LLDPRCVKAFNTERNKIIKAHNGWNRLAKLQAEQHGPLTPAQETEFEALDKLFKESCLKAEEKCRNFKDGAHDWCADYAEAEAEVYMWDLVRKYKLLRRIGKKVIKRYAKKAKIRDPLWYTLKEAHNNWLVARRYLNQLQKQSGCRHLWLDKVAKAREERDGGKFESIKKSLIHQEQQRQQGRVIKTVLKNQLRGLTHIEILLPDSTREAVHDKEKMEEYMIANN
jgi:hypothetical protein